MRERHKLGAVPYALIAAWQEALSHPGLATRFSCPIGFAVAQMRRGNAPPPLAVLNPWTERALRNLDRYESWRNVEAAIVTPAEITHEQQLEAGGQSAGYAMLSLHQLAKPQAASWLSLRCELFL